MPTIRITTPKAEHKPAWRRLFQGYADFYKVEMTDAAADAVWGWINDPSHVVEGIFAEQVAKDGTVELIGIAHVRAMPRPLSGAECGFLDDLFVDPDKRGSGAVDALFDALHAHAKQRGWPIVRWLTQEFNYRGRSVYDRKAVKTPFILYQMDTPAD